MFSCRRAFGGRHLYVYTRSASLFFAAGSLGMFLIRLFRRYNGRNLRLRRLYRQELFSSLIFIGAAVLMFWRGGIDWVVLFIIATVLQVYTAILIPREEAKEKQQ